MNAIISYLLENPQEPLTLVQSAWLATRMIIIIIVGVFLEKQILKRIFKKEDQ